MSDLYFQVPLEMLMVMAHLIWSQSSLSRQKWETSSASMCVRRRWQECRSWIWSYTWRDRWTATLSVWIRVSRPFISRHCCVSDRTLNSRGLHTSEHAEIPVTEETKSISLIAEVGITRYNACRSLFWCTTVIVPSVMSPFYCCLIV